MNIIFATHNKAKLREVKSILGGVKVNLMTPEEADVYIDVEEDGETFEANAVKKASEIMKASGELTLADDSGLEIDFLDKKPGVHSARFMGEDTDYALKNSAILEMMKDVPEERRTARFVCAIAAVLPDGRVITRSGVMEGRIAHAPEGANGFGYDPIFFVPEYGMTSAQLPPELKNRISHRGKALELMKAELELLGILR